MIERPGQMTPIVTEDNITYIPEKESTELIEASGRIGSDGTVLLLDVGRLKAKDKTLNTPFRSQKYVDQKWRKPQVSIRNYTI